MFVRKYYNSYQHIKNILTDTYQNYCAMKFAYYEKGEQMFRTYYQNQFNVFPLGQVT